MGQNEHTMIQRYLNVDSDILPMRSINISSIVTTKKISQDSISSNNSGDKIKYFQNSPVNTRKAWGILWERRSNTKRHKTVKWWTILADKSLVTL